MAILGRLVVVWGLRGREETIFVHVMAVEVESNILVNLFNIFDSFVNWIDPHNLCTCVVILIFSAWSSSLEEPLGRS